MRVIAGSARRLQLKTLPGNDTRPTTDRIKETLFNIINDNLYDAVFIDLFAGSGGIGIEALSRGAKEAAFVEKNRNAVNVIKENLVHTHLDSQAKVLQGDAVTAIDRLREYDHIDIVYMDPPYASEIEGEVLKNLAKLPGVDADTMIIIEADIKRNFAFVADLDYTVTREKTYKTNKHVFLSKS